MAAPIDWTPYMERIHSKELGTAARINLQMNAAQQFGDSVRAMFAFSENRRAEARKEAESLTSLVQLYPEDQSILGAWGKAIQQATGVPLPRDSSGKIIPPSPDLALSPEEKQFKQNDPEGWKHYMAQKFGKELSAKDAAKFEEDRAHYAVEEHHWQVMEAAATARGKKGNELDEASTYTLGPDNKPRRAQPGDQLMTWRDLNQWDKQNAQQLKADDEAMKHKRLKMAFSGKERDLKNLKELTAIAAKKNSPELDAMIDKYRRQYYIDSGEPDPGPAKNRKGLYGAVNDLLDMVRSEPAEAGEFKPVKSRGPIYKPQVKDQLTPEQEAAQYNAGSQ